MIWDLAGQEEFKVSQNIGYRDSKGAILVVDLTRKETLANIMRWRDSLMMVAGNIPMILLANKNDLKDDAQITKEDLDILGKDLNIPCYLTSAKTGKNVEMAYKILGGFMLDFIPFQPTFTSPMIQELRASASIENPDPLIVAEDRIIISFCGAFGGRALGMTVARKKFEDSRMDFRKPTEDGLRGIIDNLYETLKVFQGQEAADRAKQEHLHILKEALSQK